MNREPQVFKYFVCISCGRNSKRDITGRGACMMCSENPQDCNCPSCCDACGKPIGTSASASAGDKIGKS